MANAAVYAKEINHAENMVNFLEEMGMGKLDVVDGVVALWPCCAAFFNFLNFRR